MLQYLGDSLEVSGRHILEEDLVQEIVLMANPGVILMPGQTLPLTFFRPNVISLMKKLIDTTKVRKNLPDLPFTATCVIIIIQS